MSHIWEQVEAETGWMKNFGQAVVDAATRAERKRCLGIIRNIADSIIDDAATLNSMQRKYANADRILLEIVMLAIDTEEK